MHSRSLPLTLGSLALVALTLGGCGGSSSTGPSPPPPPPPPTAGDTAPAVLQGQWVTQVNGDQILLTLTASHYEVFNDRGPVHALGAIAVRGTEIDFLQSSLCTSGTGPYSWSITGDSLHLSAMSPDPCVDRSTVLAGITYTRRN